jgi:uncharacterized protein with ParB-like and HNH nuclease domain
MEMNRTIFNSELLCLKDVSEYNFSIPTYQRPYVWGDEQLKKIIDDFYKSYLQDKETPYYISTLITKDNDENGIQSELIDGQQRFTTLWLIALVISRLTEDSDIKNFLKKDDELRLSFEIRSEVYDYLNYLLEGNPQTKSKVVKDVESYPYLENITKAVKSIDGFLRDALSARNDSLSFEDELKHFGNFIYSKVFFIKNTTPPKTDLNKLFSTINNSGVQLEQSDIVKANLLKIIGEEKVLYSKIWEACENMNNFFERNARTSFPGSASDWEGIDLTKFVEFSVDTFKYSTDSPTSNGESNSCFKIDDIDINKIDDYPFNKKTYEDESNRDSEEIYCRSIISFEQLLLHAYRIHLKAEKKEDFKGTFHANRLIEVFKELENRNDSEEVKRFIKLLWKVRYLFDKYIIKWVSDTNTKNETLEVVNFTRNENSYYSRTNYEKSSNLMLQSVLYFTGDYLRQYWLSSYLDYLCYNHDDEAPNCKAHLDYLEHLDNVFSLTKKLTDKELSWKMMKQTDGFESDFNIEEYLKQANGTAFKHYWFYKLEYILWKDLVKNKKDDEKLKNYRITSKNSVEHIYPQNPENEAECPKIGIDKLNSFGNLVLLSVSQNSEYSNKSVGVKKSMFKEKSDTYDTLKSKYIFNNDKWDKDKIDEHRSNMIEKILKHYSPEVV